MLPSVGRVGKKWGLSGRRDERMAEKGERLWALGSVRRNRHRPEKGYTRIAIAPSFDRDRDSFVAAAADVARAAGLASPNPSVL